MYLCSFTPFAGDTASSTYNVVVPDRATNQTTVPFSVIHDIVAPTVILTLPQRIAGDQIASSRSAADAGSGVQFYDVEWRTASRHPGSPPPRNPRPPSPARRA